MSEQTPNNPGQPGDQLMAEIDFLIDIDLPHLIGQLRGTRRRLQLLRQVMGNLPAGESRPDQTAVKLNLTPRFAHNLFNEFYERQEDLRDTRYIFPLMALIALRSLSAADQADIVDAIFTRYAARRFFRGGQS